MLDLQGMCKNVVCVPKAPLDTLVLAPVWDSASCAPAHPQASPSAWHSRGGVAEGREGCWSSPGGCTRCWLPGQLVTCAVLGVPVPGLDRRRLCSCCWLCKNCRWSESGVNVYLAAPGALRGRGIRLAASWNRRMGSVHPALPGETLRLPGLEPMLRARREALHENGAQVVAAPWGSRSGNLSR